MPIVMTRSWMQRDERRDRHSPLEVDRQEDRPAAEEDEQAVSAFLVICRPRSDRPAARDTWSGSTPQACGQRAPDLRLVAGSTASVWTRIVVAHLGDDGGSTPTASTDARASSIRAVALRHRELGAAAELDAEVEPADEQREQREQEDDAGDRVPASGACRRSRRRPRRRRAGARGLRTGTSGLLPPCGGARMRGARPARGRPGGSGSGRSTERMPGLDEPRGRRAARRADG